MSCGLSKKVKDTFFVYPLMENDCCTSQLPAFFIVFRFFIIIKNIICELCHVS